MKKMVHDWDNQGRALLGAEYCEIGNFKEGTIVVFQRVSDKKFRIIPKEKAEGEVILRAEAKIDQKYRFFIPAVLRRNYKNDFELTFSKKEKCFFVKFADFAE